MFGDVYLGDDELLGRQVAIKVLRGRDPDQQAELVDEMQALNQLPHSGVVAFYHHFIKDDLLFLVMEYCGGGSLRTPGVTWTAHDQNCKIIHLPILRG